MSSLIGSYSDLEEEFGDNIFFRHDIRIGIYKRYENRDNGVQWISKHVNDFQFKQKRFKKCNGIMTVYLFSGKDVLDHYFNSVNDEMSIILQRTNPYGKSSVALFKNVSFLEREWKTLAYHEDLFLEEIMKYSFEAEKFCDWTDKLLQYNKDRKIEDHMSFTNKIILPGKIHVKHSVEDIFDYLMEK